MLRNKASSSNGHKITSNPANKWFFYVMIIFWNGCLSISVSAMCGILSVSWVDLWTPMLSFRSVWFLFYSLFFFCWSASAFRVISTDRSLIELTVLILQSWSKFETCVINPSKWAIRYNIYDTIVQAQFVIADFSSRLTLNLFWKKQKKQIPTTIN